MWGRQYNFKVFLTTFLVSLLVCVTFLSTFTWFSDNTTINLTINPASLSTQSSVTEELSPEDLVPGNTFTKTLNVNFTAGFDLYFRTYVVSKMNTNGGVREDLIRLTSVESAKKVNDNKFYYQDSSNMDENNLTKVSASQTAQVVSLTYVFEVDSSVSSALFSGLESTANKTTLTFIIEYCQVEAASEWIPANAGL